MNGLRCNIVQHVEPSTKASKLNQYPRQFFVLFLKIFIAVLLGARNQETSSGQVFSRCSGGRCE